MFKFQPLRHYNQAKQSKAKAYKKHLSLTKGNKDLNMDKPMNLDYDTIKMEKNLKKERKHKPGSKWNILLHCKLCGKKINSIDHKCKKL